MDLCMAENKAFTIAIYEKYCKACGICIAFCPKKVFIMDEKGKPEAVYPDQCNGCSVCELRCPDFAIRVGRND